MNSYIALARKWRPASFAEVVGQEHVVQALRNSLQSERLHHAYLFSGTRGIGKTTIARIFAKVLNCETGEGSEPCQQCGHCKAVDEGRFVDLIEVDAASRTKVDDTRELLENVHYAPTLGRYKIFLIDEVHMLSTHSFNALLKTLEEPPQHVKFLLATTDPQKLPITVLSRCLQFHLKVLSAQQIENQMVEIMRSEGIDYQAQGLRAISRAAQGSMRDALSLLDQAISISQERLDTVAIEKMLGSVQAAQVNELLQAVTSSDGSKVMRVVAEMAEQSVDFGRALDDVISLIHRIAVVQLTGEDYDEDHSDVDFLRQMADRLDTETIQLYYQIGLMAKKDLQLAPSLQVGFEMAMLRMMAFEPVGQHSQAIMPSESPARQSIDAVDGINATNANGLTPTSSKQDAKTEVNSSSTEESLPPFEIDIDIPQSNGDIDKQLLANENEWAAIVDQIDLNGMSRELAMNCAKMLSKDEEFQLCLSPELQYLHTEERQIQLRDALSAHLKREVKLDISIESSELETPAECAKRLGIERKQEIERELRAKPVVQALITEFDATFDVDNTDLGKPN